uniref:Sodium/hydrogen exchanger 3-like protein n=1 Tax=Sinonovacula constricta TaxID=98310 RepID=A0A513U881_SINCO|nr:sodium/hydrogen exchanger 3-like protein [Sinonovacula constricta]
MTVLVNSKQWRMNRRHTLADSTESLSRVVFHRPRPNNSALPLKSSLKNGRMNKDTSLENSESMSSSSETAGVTINFTISTKDTATVNSSPLNSHTDISPLEETMAEKSLPWRDNSVVIPSPTHLVDSIPNDEPVIAQVPTWVNNLSYSHITETGSPYTSPQVTIIPQTKSKHNTVYSLFEPLPENEKYGNNKTEAAKSWNPSDYFPIPWGHNGDLEECPQVSPMVTENSERSCDMLHSTHTEQAPDHHHVIIPTNHHFHIDSENGSSCTTPHLTEVASAPDFHHWKALKKASMNEGLHRLQSDTMLIEMAFQEGVKNRVQEWLKLASDEEANDADDDDDDNDDDDDDDENDFVVNVDGLNDIEDLELELDKEMNLKP